MAPRRRSNCSNGGPKRKVMPDRYLSFSRVGVSFGANPPFLRPPSFALVSDAALRSTTTVSYRWNRGEKRGGTTWIVRSSRDTGLGSEGENFVYRFLARYAGRRGSCSSATERRKKERREEGKKNPPRRGVKTRNGISVIPNI